MKPSASNTGTTMLKRVALTGRWLPHEAGRRGADVVAKLDGNGVAKEADSR